MGRYKSVLKARADAREFPHQVDVPVPPMGLGSLRDEIERWLHSALGTEWRHHGAGNGAAHVARFMFRTRKDAELFETAWRKHILAPASRGKYLK